MYFNFKIKKYILVGVIITFILISIITMTSGFAITANTTPNNSIELPIIMYHGILKDSKLQGQYVISPTAFEKDLKYLKEQGYSTITVKDLIDYVYNNIDLPSKPIMLTFDDGYYNNYLYAFPLLKEYNFKMVLSPIITYTDLYSDSSDKGASYAHATWDELKEMQESGLVEIQNHSYNLHCSNGARLGAKQKQGENEAAYKKVITEDIGKAQNSLRTNINCTPTAFVYPFGAISKCSDSIIKEMGFKCSIICESRVNTVTKDTECLYSMGRFIRNNKNSVQQILADICK